MCFRLVILFVTISVFPAAAMPSSSNLLGCLNDDTVNSSDVLTTIWSSEECCMVQNGEDSTSRDCRLSHSLDPFDFTFGCDSASGFQFVLKCPKPARSGNIMVRRFLNDNCWCEEVRSNDNCEEDKRTAKLDLQRTKQLQRYDRKYFSMGGSSSAWRRQHPGYVQIEMAGTSMDLSGNVGSTLSESMHAFCLDATRSSS